MIHRHRWVELCVHRCFQRQSWFSQVNANECFYLVSLKEQSWAPFSFIWSSSSLKVLSLWPIWSSIQVKWSQSINYHSLISTLSFTLSIKCSQCSFVKFDPQTLCSSDKDLLFHLLDSCNCSNFLKVFQIVSCTSTDYRFLFAFRKLSLKQDLTLG